MTIWNVYEVKKGSASLDGLRKAEKARAAAGPAGGIDPGSARHPSTTAITWS